MHLPQIDIDLFPAAQIVAFLKKASVSLLKEKLRVSTPIAKEIIQQLQAIRIIEKIDDSPNYKVLVDDYDLIMYIIKLDNDYNMPIPIRGRIFTDIGTDLFVAARIVTSLKESSAYLLENQLRITYSLAFKMIRLLEKFKIIEKIGSRYRVIVEFIDLIPFVEKLNEPMMIIPLKERVFTE